MLYFTERGRVLAARNEEIWAWVRVRKTFQIEPADADGELCLLAYEYRGNELPLHIKVGGTELTVPCNPDAQGQYVWRTVALPAAELKTPEVVVTVSCPAPAMSAWILAVDLTGNKGASLKSMDRGRTWRTDGMGYDCVLSGEYLIRLWAPGKELRHPALPFIYEDPHHPRLGELREFLAARMGALPSGSDYDRALALKDWLAAQWQHQGGGAGAAYGAWEATTLLDWTKRKGGHALRNVVAFCVHFAVAFAQFAAALGLEARLAFSESTTPTAFDGGHCVPEVYCRQLQKWVVLDPDVDVVPMLDGRPLSALELHRLVTSERAEALQLISGPNHASRSDEIREFWKRTWPKALFRRWGILPRNDFFSNPQAFPCEHGVLSYHCVDMLWYDPTPLPPYRWHPYYSSDDSDFLFHRSPEA